MPAGHASAEAERLHFTGPCSRYNLQCWQHDFKQTLLLAPLHSMQVLWHAENMHISSCKLQDGHDKDRNEVEIFLPVAQQPNCASKVPRNTHTHTRITNQAYPFAANLTDTLARFQPQHGKGEEPLHK